MYNLSIKFACLILAATLTLAGCGSSSSSNDDPTPTPPPTNPPGDDEEPGPEPEPPAELDFEHLHELAEFPIGVSVDGRNGMPPAAEHPVIEQHFNQLTAGNIMKMSYLHNNWNTYTFNNADRLVEYAAENDMTMHGHALVWHSCYQVPNWARNFEGDKEDFLDLVYEHAETVASHYETNYAGTVVSWDVVNEAFQDSGAYREPVQNCNSNGEGSVFGYHAEGPEFIEAAFWGAHAGAPSADLYYNDFSLVPNGPKFRGGDDTPGVLGMLDDFLERDVPIDGIGFQMHIYVGWPSISNIRSAFEAVVDRGLKVKITELDVAAYNPYGNETFKEYTQELADQQKQRYCEIMEAYLDVVPKDQRGGFTVWGVSDADTWLKDLSHYSSGNPWPLLFDENLEPKPAIMGVADALRGRPCS